MGCGCDCSDPCTLEDNCPAVCTALTVMNSWNVPACNATAVLYVPGITSVLLQTSIYNPTYGYFRITAFDSVHGLITVTNDCSVFNAIPGTSIPAQTQFIFGVPQSSTWQSYSPVWFQNVPITYANHYSKYIVEGKKVTYQWTLFASSPGAAASVISLGMPVNGVPTGVIFKIIGNAHFYSAGSGISYLLGAYQSGTNTILFTSDTSGGLNFGVLPSIAVAAGDYLSGSVVYEIT